MFELFDPTDWLFPDTGSLLQEIKKAGIRIMIIYVSFFIINFCCYYKNPVLILKSSQESYFLKDTGIFDIRY